MGSSGNALALALMLLGLPFLFLSGCRADLAPDTPEALTKRKAYSADDLARDRDRYDAAATKGTSDGIQQATLIRNRMLWSIVNDIDFAYYNFKTSFYEQRARIKTAGDLAELGLDSAATALGGSAILSAAATALKGANLSIDRNYYREKATEVLFVKMDALRQQQMAVIERKMGMSAPGYDFEEAYRDTLGLFGAGTVPAAIQGIASDAGTQQSAATAEIKEAVDERSLKGLLPATEEMVRSAREIRHAILALTDTDLEKANHALAAYGEKPAPNIAVARDHLKQWLYKAEKPEELKKLQDALK